MEQEQQLAVRPAETPQRRADAVGDRAPVVLEKSLILR